MRKEVFAWLAALAALAQPTLALGADPPPTEIALARRLFDEARTAEESKDWVSAASKLRDAISIKETSGLRFHLAYCEEQQGMLVEALVDYERADDLSVGRDEELRSQIPARKSSLQKRIPTVTLLLTRDPSTASLAVDGRMVAQTSFGKPIPLNPGKHAFVVSSPGFTTFTTELPLNEGDAVVTNVVLTPESNEASAPTMSEVDTAPAASAAKGRKAASPVRTYVLVGEAAVALGALAVGIAFTLEGASEDERASNDRTRLASANKGSAADACVSAASNPEVPSLCADLATAVDGARHDRLVAGLGFVGAGVGAAAFAATLALWPSKRPQMAIRPWIDPSARGLSLEGRF
jgi:hypothetical protein